MLEMSERTEVDQEYDKDEDASQSSGNVPEQQYSREELMSLSKSSVSVQRPQCLDPAYDSEDGRWDPDRWYKAQFELPGEVSPVTLADGKDRRRPADLDREVKRIPSLNEPAERLKEDKDGIVLGPQRRSFGTGCHVQTRQLSLPDRDESRVEKERDRERPVRKIGSGRIQIDRENSRDYSGLRDRFDDRDPRDREQDRDRDFAWNRERDWDRDVRDTDWDRDRDRRFDRTDRFRRGSDFSERERRDRDFRERGFDRNARRRNNFRGDEREPEWFTRGPSSQHDTIELRGFELEPAPDVDETGTKKSQTRITPTDKSSKESSAETDVKFSQRSSPEEDQQVMQHEPQKQPETPQHSSTASPSTHKMFDFDEILKASILPLEEEPTYQGSRFSRFFSAINGQGSETSSMEDMLVPHDLLEDSHASSQSPTSLRSAGSPHQGQHYMPPFMEQPAREHRFPLPQNFMSAPNPAGDNNAVLDKQGTLMTTLFSRTAQYGLNTSSGSSKNFSTQDAEAQLKAMLFGGHKESASSSGTASPANLPPSVQRKVKTVAELEADMHQNSPQKRNSSLSVNGYGVNPNNSVFNTSSSVANPNESVASPSNSGDLTAFNKLLVMINAASEGSQHATVLKSREEQTHGQQQAVLHQQQSFHAQLPSAPIAPHQQQSFHAQQSSIPSAPHQQILAHSFQQHANSMVNQQTLPASSFPQQPALSHSHQIAGLLTKPPGTPLSSPHMKPRAHSGGPLVSSDPIYNLIQQNPTILMNPASPGPNISAILASQQSVGASTARISSPLMFSQQPPLHLSAPSPIHPTQLSPRSLAVGGGLGTNTISSPTGMRSPALPRVLSPQELSAHAQSVMQSALIKKQLLDQNERYLKKQQNRAKSPGQQQMNPLKAQSASQAVPPTKNMPVSTFTPTSVLLKMHSDKALEREKQVSDAHGDEYIEYMPEFAGGDLMDSYSLDGSLQKSERQFLEDLCDISFLDSGNPDLVAMTNQLRLGQTPILPGPLSQPMSVEEKIKLSALAENPGYLSQMLDNSIKVESSRMGQGRPIVRAQEPTQEDRALLFALQQHQPPPPIIHSGRPVTGGSPNMQLSFTGPQNMQSNLALFPSLQQSVSNKPPNSGRAIVGGNSSQQQHLSQLPGVPAQNMDMLRMMDLQRLQQLPHSQGMVLPPPPMGTPISYLGPPPAPGRMPMAGGPGPSMHQQPARANVMSGQHNQQISQFLAMQQTQQQRHQMPPMPSHHMVMPGSSAHMSPRIQAAGPLSPAALTATIQRVASPHRSMKMNGALAMSSAVNGGSGQKVDLNSGIQRWFSPDILKTQLPSMPPLPTKGNQVMTVDELEGN